MTGPGLILKTFLAAPTDHLYMYLEIHTTKTFCNCTCHLLLCMQIPSKTYYGAMSLAGTFVSHVFGFTVVRVEGFHLKSQ